MVGEEQKQNKPLLHDIEYQLMDMLIDLKEDGVLRMSEELKTSQDIPELQNLEEKISVLTPILTEMEYQPLDSPCNLEPKLLNIYDYIDYDKEDSKK